MRLHRLLMLGFMGLLVGCGPTTTGTEGGPGPDGGASAGGGSSPDTGDGPAPGPGTLCPGRRCRVQVLATAQQGPLGIAVAGGHVYWASTEGQRVSRVPVSGGIIETVASTEARPFTLAADATHVYWIAHASTKGGLWRVPLAGGTLEPLRTLPYTMSNRVRVSGSHVYWVDGSISRVSTGGGTPETLVVGPGSFDFAADADSVYYSAPPNLHQLTVGGTPVLLAQVPEGFDVPSLATDADAVYAVMRTQEDNSTLCRTTRVVRIPKGGGEAQLLGEHPGLCAMETAVDDTHVYAMGFTGFGSTSILRIPKQGGAPEVVVEGIGYGWRFALDATHVYWTEVSSGRVARVVKP